MYLHIPVHTERGGGGGGGGGGSNMKGGAGGGTLNLPRELQRNLTSNVLKTQGVFVSR